MPRIFVTRKIPEMGIQKLLDKGYEVDISPKSRPLSKKEIIKFLNKKSYDGVLSMLTDTIDKEVFEKVSSVKIFANYAVGFNNIDIEEARKRNIVVTNTPGGSTESVAEHTFALLLALTRRITEGDQFMYKGKFTGFDPMLLWGDEIGGKTLGIIGTGRIGGRVAEMAKKGFGMKIIYHDVVRNSQIENELGTVYMPTIEEVLKNADIVSLHVPLMPSTHHLMNRERLAMMKKSAYLINTSRGPVVDEIALAEVMRNGGIRGAGLDVFEFEPKIERSIRKLPNVVVSPHVASATPEARIDMAKMSADNLIDFFEGRKPRNKIN